jgi:hypothetical protein
MLLAKLMYTTVPRFTHLLKEKKEGSLLTFAFLEDKLQAGLSGPNSFNS